MPQDSNHHDDKKMAFMVARVPLAIVAALLIMLVIGILIYNR